MQIRCCFLALVIGFFFAARASAQAPSVVQLPSFSFFTVDTTVSVPDRGTASLGGIGRSSSGSTAFGPALGPANRGFGRSLSSSSVTMRATIHDFDALDRAALARADRRAGNRLARNAWNDRSTRRDAAQPNSSQRAPLGSVADARRRHAAESAAQEAETQSNLEHARRAAADGKAGVAKIFYKMALRHAPGELKSQINRELAALK